MRKRILLIIGAFAITIILLGLAFLIGGSNNQPPSFPAPTPQSSGFNQQGPIQTNLPQDQLLILSVVSPVTIVFEKPIDQNSLSFNIMPATEVFIVTENATEVSFKPKLFWEPNVLYTLRITSVKGLDGSMLTNSYQINFKAINTADEEHSSEAEVSNNP